MRSSFTVKERIDRPAFSPAESVVEDAGSARHTASSLWAGGDVEGNDKVGDDDDDDDDVDAVCASDADGKERREEEEEEEAEERGEDDDATDADADDESVLIVVVDIADG